MAKKISSEKYKKRMTMSATSLLFTMVRLFTMCAFLLLSVKGGKFDMQAVVMAFLVPFAFTVVEWIMSKLWPIDKALLILCMFLVSIGLVTIKGISSGYKTPFTQCVYALAGVPLMFVAAFTVRHIRSWEKWAMVLAPLAICALLLPFPLGKWYSGARNWIFIGGYGESAGFSAQPSEFVKPILVIVLASGLSNRPTFIRSSAWVAFSAVLCGILLIERDLGALLLYFTVTMLMYYVSTRNLPITLLGFLAAAVGSVFAYRFLPYLQKRIDVFVNPLSDPYGIGYQPIQALIAIASGSWFGAGLGLGSPKSIPLIDSDLVFAAVTEEFGIVFSVGLICVYALIAMRGVIIARNARTSFHALTAFGLTMFITSQAMLIIAGTLKLVPLTGITLPFIARGGSSLVATMISLGMLLGISSINADRDYEDYVWLREAELK